MSHENRGAKFRSFFPAEWPPEMVFEKVIEAYGNILERTPANLGREKIIGWLAKDQQAIEIIIDNNEKAILTAYPHFSLKGPK